MSDFKNIESVIEENGNISKKSRTSALSYIYIFVGLCLIVCAFAMEMNKNVDFAMKSIGVVISIIGIISVIKPKKYLCYNPSNEEVREHIFYFDAKDKKAIHAAIESGDLNLAKLIKSGSTNMRAIVYATPSKNFILTQMQAYIPHEYVPIEDPAVISGNTSQSN